MTDSIMDKIDDFFVYPPSEKNSLLISFEGIEGSGKTTQIKKLKSFLEEKQKQNVISLREPGGTPFGEKLRQAILEHEGPLNEMAQALLFASSRAQLLSEKILPALKSPNTVIILDRYLDSSLAYQGEAAGLGADVVLNLHRFSPLNYIPHMTFYLKISLECSFQRMSSRGEKADFFESQQKEFHEKLITGLEKASKIFPKRIYQIDAEDTEENVFNEIKKVLENFQK